MQSKNPGNFMVPFGINHRELVEAAGGLISRTAETDLRRPDDGICHGDNGCTGYKDFFLYSGVLKKMLWQRVLETACINCGRCVESLSKQNYSIQTCRFFKETKMRHLLLHGMDWNVWNVVPAVMSVRRNVS